MPYLVFLSLCFLLADQDGRAQQLLSCLPPSHRLTASETVNPFITCFYKNWISLEIQNVGDTRALKHLPRRAACRCWHQSSREKYVLVGIAERVGLSKSFGIRCSATGLRICSAGFQPPQFSLLEW